MNPGPSAPEEKRADEAKAGKWAGVFRFLWYLFATVLVLSLPTFSYLVPDPQYSFISRFNPAGSPTGTDEMGPAKQVSDPDYVLERRLIQSSQRRGSAGSRRVLSGLLPPQRSQRPRPVSGRRSNQPVVAGQQSQQAPVDTEAKPAVQPPPMSASQNLPPAMVPNEAQALAQLEQGYQRLASNMAYRSRYAPRGGNPFQDALDGGSGGAGDGGDSSSGGDSGTGSSDSGNNSGDSGSTPGDSGNSGGSGEPPGLDVVDSGPGSSYQFLIVGPLAGNPSSSLVSRGNLRTEGDFVLENFYSFSLFPGGFHSLLVFDEDTTLLTGDFNRDGQSDFLTVQFFPGVGTRVEAFAAGTSGFTPHGSVFFYYTTVHDLAIFDFDRDGQDELGILFEGSKNLFIYRLKEGAWTYSRELVLPFQTDVIFTARLLQGEKPALFLIDRTLTQVATVTQEQPNLFQFGLSSPLQRLRKMEVRWTKHAPISLVQVLEMRDRIILFSRESSRYRSIASIDLSLSAPLVIVGDYLGNGTRQLVVLP